MTVGSVWKLEEVWYTRSADMGITLAGLAAVSGSVSLKGELSLQHRAVTHAVIVTSLSALIFTGALA